MFEISRLQIMNFISVFRPASLALLFGVAALGGCADTHDDASVQQSAEAEALNREHLKHIEGLGSNAEQSRILYNGSPVYLSGFNIAWFDFARDVGAGISEPALRVALQDVATAGGNTLRWWMHIDGSLTPEWGDINGERMVVGPGKTFLEDLKLALDIATEYKVYIVPSLWSFDMLKKNDYRNPPSADNFRLLTDPQVLQSYIDNALIPMVKALNSHPQLVAWELFNEPENMTESWLPEQSDFYGGAVPTLEQLQRVQATMAAAIHRTAIDQGEVALVTTGSKSMGKYNSDVAGGFNWYRDDRMITAAGGDPLATLDFYQPHYYNNEGKQGRWSPFHHPASYWAVNKPIVVGEFHVEDLNVLDEPIAAFDLCKVLHEHGYAGGWGWQWNEHSEQLIACLKRLHQPSAAQ